MKLEIRATNDGSQTLYVPELDEHYHSFHGAVQEAKHVFLANGIAYLHQKEIKVLEVGLGTGLNALLTALWAEENQVKVSYVGLEAYPVPLEMNKQMNYVDCIENHQAKRLFDDILEAKWELASSISPYFELTKQSIFIQDWSASAEFDLVYFDAFGPRAQSEMWDFSIIKRVIDALKPGGVFVTYCAKGQLKRDLKALHCQVESLLGPPGKREMTRAIKI